MRTAGYLVIEVPEGQEVKVLQPMEFFPSSGLPPNQLLADVLEAIVWGSTSDQIGVTRLNLLKALAHSAKVALEESK